MELSGRGDEDADANGSGGVDEVVGAGVPPAGMERWEVFLGWGVRRCNHSAPSSSGERRRRVGHRVSRYLFYSTSYLTKI